MKNITINSMQEMQPYYNAVGDVYSFPGSAKFNCVVDVRGCVKAENIEGENVFCGNIYTTRAINIKKIIADYIQCDTLKACEVTCHALKDANTVNVDHLNATIITGCNDVKAKTIKAITIVCNECSCGELDAKRIDIGYLNKPKYI